MNHAQIIDTYRFDETAHRTLQRDAVARLEAETKAGNFAAELRAMARKPKPITYIRSNKLFCIKCGSRNTVMIGKRFADCRSCGHSWAR